MSVIYAYIGVVLGVNVGIYGIHGVFGYHFVGPFGLDYSLIWTWILTTASSCEALAREDDTVQYNAGEIRRADSVSVFR